MLIALNNLYLFIFIVVVGNKRVNVKLKRGGQALIDQMKKIITQSSLREEISKNLDERGKTRRIILKYT